MSVVFVPPVPEPGRADFVTDEGNAANQIGYSTLFVLLAAWCLLHQPQRLLFLVRPILIVTLLWFALTVVTSWDPSQSARRFAFALITIGIAAMVLLLPKNPRHFSDVMAAVVLIVLIASYLGVLFVPNLTIHQATDMVEPELAGDWRGIFGHKNEASGDAGPVRLHRHVCRSRAQCRSRRPHRRAELAVFVHHPLEDRYAGTAAGVAGLHPDGAHPETVHGDRDSRYRCWSAST